MLSLSIIVLKQQSMHSFCMQRLIYAFLTMYKLFSCGDCVDTENACGWCLYGGFCSGTSFFCPVPAGVNNSYLIVIPITFFLSFYVKKFYNGIRSLYFSSWKAVLDLLMCVLLLTEPPLFLATIHSLSMWLEISLSTPATYHLQ